MSGIIQYFVLLWLIYSTETAAWAESLGNSHVRESVSLWDPSGMERLGSLGTAVPRTHFSKTVIEGSVPGRGKHARASFHTCPSLDSSCFFPGTNVLIGRIEKAILKSCSVGSKLKWMKRIESWLHWAGNTVRGVPVCVVPCSWFPYSCPPGLSEWHRPSPRCCGSQDRPEQACLALPVH